MLKKFLDSVDKVIGGITVFIGAVALFVMVTISFVNVITRYFPQLGLQLSFAEEVTINMFVWITLAGTSMAFRHGSNLNMTFLYEHFPKPIRKVCYWISVFLTVAFFGLLTYLGAKQVCDEITMGAITEALAIPTWYYTIAVPIFSIMIIIRFLVAVYDFVSQDKF